jgi:hypothetical protein
MKNFRKLVVNEIKAAGRVLIKPTVHGELYRNGETVIEVPKRVDTRKIANNLIRRATRE